MPDAPFPHLALVALRHGPARLFGGGEPDPRIAVNKDQRQQHVTHLSGGLTRIGQRFNRISLERAAQGLPPIEGGVPFMLEVAEGDEGLLDFLETRLGLEVVAEYPDGFLMVSAADVAMPEFQDVLKAFQANKHGATRAASVFEIHDEPDAEIRLKRMLGDDLFAFWPFPDDKEFILEVSFKSPTTDGLKPKPNKRKKEKPEAYEHRLAAWEEERRHAMIAIDNEQMRRETLAEQMIQPYRGVLLSGFAHSATPHSQFAELSDSFSVRIRMLGRGFKDLIQNHPHVFELSLPDDVLLPSVLGVVGEPDYPPVELAAPEADGKAVCVVDSGIQENHRMLQAAMDVSTSRCFIPNVPANDVADYVVDGGHGTRVAGAALYGASLPGAGRVEAPFWLQNARLLLGPRGELPRAIHPPVALREIIEHFRDGPRHTRIFNHSISSDRPARSLRMSSWAAEMDFLSHSRDVLFIQAIGNLSRGHGSQSNPTIEDHLSAGRSWPDYLFERSARLANPAQSLQALTVGSIAMETYRDGNRRSVARATHPSAFTRCGCGLWDSMKPDVVEFGGDYAWDGANPVSLALPPGVCPSLVRSTLDGGPAVARDVVGTSFAAGRVTHVAGLLEKLLPDESTLVYRALIAQSARWPDWAERAVVDEKAKHIRLLGYGVPDADRATSNSEYRVTCITQGNQSIKAGDAAIFAFYVPEELRRMGQEAVIRLDVTLSYSAEPRRTRSSGRRYLAVWLDWVCSRPGEAL
ncbi:MAG TPA: S8 family peptidase, partial [Candidatus Paceibacterota bacterium]|nr:S8 family peptidase [Candidatus Paceibacterota bacterium]